jgi:hypothetical protein
MIYWACGPNVMGQQDGSWSGFRVCHPLPKSLATFNAESLTLLQSYRHLKYPTPQTAKLFDFLNKCSIGGPLSHTLA